MQRGKDRPWQKLLLGIPLLCMLIVGPTRVYLGDHWATDVLGGYLFGGGWLGLSLQLYLKLRQKGAPASDQGLGKGSIGETPS